MPGTAVLADRIGACLVLPTFVDSTFHVLSLTAHGINLQRFEVIFRAAG